MGRPYPKWGDFPVEKIMYGLGAPYVGIGIYTMDGEFSWPDREGTMKREYDAWVAHLKAHDYDIPEEYLDATLPIKWEGGLDCVDKIRERIQQNRTHAEIAKEFQVHPGTVSKIRRGIIHKETFNRPVSGTVKGEK